MASDVHALKALLRGAGLRATGPRTAVLRVLAESKGAVSHAELAERLATSGVDRATVYRNLVDLTEAGLARRSDMGDHVWRFELIVERKEHDDVVHAHFLCSGCGTVACLPDSAVTLAPSRATPKALRKRDVQIEVRGLCDTCA